MQTEPPSFTTEQVVAAVRRAAPGLAFDPRVDLVLLKIDDTDVCRWLADCQETEIHKHELDDKYPIRQHYIVVLHLEVEDYEEYYVKVRLSLPNLDKGRVISFWPWRNR